MVVQTKYIQSYNNYFWEITNMYYYVLIYIVIMLE